MGPMGHSLSGLSVYYGYCLAARRAASARGMLLSVFLANLPDFDLLPALWVGFPRANHFHHSYTHTFAFALLVGCVAGAILWTISGRFFHPAAGLSASLVGVHVALDYFTRDTGYPFGEMLFWPVSSTYFLGPTLFMDIHKGSWSDLFSLHNVNATLFELLIFTPVLSWLVLQMSSRREAVPGG